MAPPPEPQLAKPNRTALSRLAGRVGGHSVIYVLSASMSVVAGLLSVAVITRFLAPHEFGELALLMVAGSTLTLIYNLGSLQGTTSWVFGTSGDEDDGDSSDVGAGAKDSRRGLTTGLALTAGVGTVGTLIVAPLAGPISTWLLGSDNDASLVVWSAVGAALAAVWRLAANTIRLERRPWSYLIAAATSQLLGIALAIPLLVAGRGVEGVVIGMTIGNALAVAVAFVLIRRSMRWAWSRHDAVNIMRRGRALVPVVAGFYALQVADVLVLSRFVPASDVGLYRVASRIGAVVSYWTSSFHMAWGPMRRDPLHLAADAELGRGIVASVMATYFSILTFWVVLGAALFAEEFIRIAAPDYAQAAPLIPFTASAFALHGFYVLVYRTVEFPRKRIWFIVLSVVNAVVFLLSALLWIPALGSYGASAAIITGWTTGIVVLLGRARQEPDQIRYQSGRILAAVLIAGALLAIDKSLEPHSRGLAAALDLVMFLTYPVALFLTGTLPRRDVMNVMQAIGRTLTGRLGRHLQTLAPEEHALLDEALRQRRSPSELAKARGLAESEVDAQVVAALRQWGGLGDSRAGDDRLGAYILSQGAFIEREAASRRMMQQGVDPLDADAVTRAAAALRRQTRSQWRAALREDAIERSVSTAATDGNGASLHR